MHHEVGRGLPGLSQGHTADAFQESRAIRLGSEGAKSRDPGSDRGEGVQHRTGLARTPAKYAGRGVEQVEEALSASRRR